MALEEQAVDKLLASAPTRPGVYQFFDDQGKPLYVGKAKVLKNRLMSYFRDSNLAPKTRVMVAKIADVLLQTTATEGEALLLESNLIKKNMPRYNVALKDDKSYPYIRLNQNKAFPRFEFYRGGRKDKAHYYGPYPNAQAVREMIDQLSKIFLIRQCPDNVFKHRSRPCLQYQIKRCSAPCVNLIGETDYNNDIAQARAMLEGDDSFLIARLGEQMEQAAEALEFEQAALYRDRVAKLQRVRESQYVSSGKYHADVVAVACDASKVCFGVSTIRNGQSFGGRFYIRNNPLGLNEAELLATFLPQHYLGNEIPEELIVSEAIKAHETLVSVFTAQAGHKVEIKFNCRAPRSKWLATTLDNTRAQLARHLNEQSQLEAQFKALAQRLKINEPIERIECFDISHTMGEKPMASCVVFDNNGARKMDYRRYHLTGITDGDDYAAMRQALERRYEKLIREDAILPDMVIVDGGKGQLNIAHSVLEELQIDQRVLLLGVSKGLERKAGEEVLHLLNPPRAIKPAATSPESHLIQQIRDEAHRFAITGHRQARAKARKRSVLQDIHGIGDKKRSLLLKTFGGVRELQRAGIEDIAKVPGISTKLAEKIYQYFHH